MHEDRFLVGKAHTTVQNLRTAIENCRTSLKPHLERLYTKAPEPIRIRMKEDGHDPLMDIFERGEGYVRIDYGPAGSFSTREQAQDACHRLAVAWTDEIFIELRERTSSIHLHLFPASLPPCAKSEN